MYSLGSHQYGQTSSTASNELFFPNANNLKVVDMGLRSPVRPIRLRPLSCTNYINFMVPTRGLEPPTSSLQERRTTNCATSALVAGVGFEPTTEGL